MHSDNGINVGDWLTTIQGDPRCSVVGLEAAIVVASGREPDQWQRIGIKILESLGYLAAHTEPVVIDHGNGRTEEFHARRLTFPAEIRSA
ncbi:hypothetical protein OG921_06840 [Aldersonia sp. NBC_00410]|uniref:hypothetical protein n=1 Tax=Aldersonia sp. NBC_00410 TaxID=2975954 RepID=UPI00225668F1|nr:hypothetical protein [Aldersonia sp. NBC_00410]MCX5042881.1 hypothetical protein [Aldersonia sp. NBC_00410]